jgi:ribonuclease PH
VALELAIASLIASGALKESPIIGQVAAVSCGVYKGVPVLDLDYDEDSSAEMDANFVLTEDGRIIEIQCTAEDVPVEEAAFQSLFTLARSGVAQLAFAQREAIKG